MHSQLEALVVTSVNVRSRKVTLLRVRLFHTKPIITAWKVDADIESGRALKQGLFSVSEFHTTRAEQSEEIAHRWHSRNQPQL